MAKTELSFKFEDIYYDKKSNVEYCFYASGRINCTPAWYNDEYGSYTNGYEYEDEDIEFHDLAISIFDDEKQEAIELAEKDYPRWLVAMIEDMAIEKAA